MFLNFGIRNAITLLLTIHKRQKVIFDIKTTGPLSKARISDIFILSHYGVAKCLKPNSHYYRGYSSVEMLTIFPRTGPIVEPNNIILFQKVGYLVYNMFSKYSKNPIYRIHI